MIQTAKQHQSYMKKNKKDIIEYYISDIGNKLRKKVSKGYYDITIKVADYVLKDVIKHFQGRGYYCTLFKKGLFISWHPCHTRVLDTIKKRGNVK